MKVEFHDVGRSKSNWSAECKEITYNWLYNQVKAHGVLSSSSLDFEYDEENDVGKIYAGFYVIGTFRCED